MEDTNRKRLINLIQKGVAITDIQKVTAHEFSITQIKQAADKIFPLKNYLTKSP